MALRSLAVMLKELPRRMPGSGALAPKGNPWSKSSKLTNPTRYGSLEDTDIAKRWAQLEQNMKRSWEESERQMSIYSRYTELMGLVACAYVWRRTLHHIFEDLQ